MAYTGAKTSSFSWDTDGGPRVEAEHLLVLDVRPIKNDTLGEPGTDKWRRALIRHPAVVKDMMVRAERWLEAHPDGHVAFGCRLGKDRSPALAAELARRLALKAHNALLQEFNVPVQF